jgi:hypothetical protein
MHQSRSKMLGYSDRDRRERERESAKKTLAEKAHSTFKVQVARLGSNQAKPAGSKNVPILAENHVGHTVESGRVEARCAVPVVRVTAPSTACRASGRTPPRRLRFPASGDPARRGQCSHAVSRRPGFLGRASLPIMDAKNAPQSAQFSCKALLKIRSTQNGRRHPPYSGGPP